MRAVQLSVERFHERLGGQPVGPTYFFYGDEPLQLLECADALRKRAFEEGVEERCVFDAEIGIDWQGLADEGNALSLFAVRRLFEIRLGERKPDKAGAEILARLASREQADDIVVVSAGKPDAASKKATWFTALESHAVCVASRDLRGAALPEWLARRAKRYGKRLAPAAAELIADRVEGNMLAAAQEVEKLCLLVDAELISEEDVLGAVRDSARYDVFQLADAVVGGELPRALRIIRGLREEGTEPLLLNWALGRELRQLAGISSMVKRGTAVDAALEQYRVWSNRRPAVKRLLARLNTDDLFALLAYANFIDTVVKGAHSGEPWDEIEILTMKMAGARGVNGLLRKL